MRSRERLMKMLIAADMEGFTGIIHYSNCNWRSADRLIS
jgi:hypothetical protein